MKTNREIAQATKEYLQKVGWTNEYHGGGGDSPTCVMVAAERVQDRAGIPKPRQKEFDKTIHAKMGTTDDYESFCWNDRQTSVEAIYQLLDSIED